MSAPFRLLKENDGYHSPKDIYRLRTIRECPQSVVGYRAYEVVERPRCVDAVPLSHNWTAVLSLLCSRRQKHDGKGD
jgi:hypothetical protein